jgi:hypothetical protein
VAAIKTLKRSELYALVWQEPMARLARKFAISDVGLAKICRKYDIPRPPRGYWAKLQFGQEPPQTPLPPITEDHEIELRDGADAENPATSERAELEQLVAGQQIKDARIEVAETLRGAHPLVSQANQELQSSRTNEQGMIVGAEKPTLAIETSKAALRRSLLIMDALLKALEKQGYAVQPGPGVTILGVLLRLKITETLETQREPADENKLEGHYEFGFNRFKEKRIPSGRLVLSILEGGSYWLNGCRYTWRDTDTQKLEDRLNTVVRGLVQMAAKIQRHEEIERKEKEVQRLEAEKRAERARLIAEKRAQQKAEKSRVEQLIATAENWNQSKLIRELVETVRKAHSMTGPINAESEIAKWLAWAGLQADRLDPLTPSPPSILDEEIPEEEPSRHRDFRQW